jgi:hypothetical protein
MHPQSVFFVVSDPFIEQLEGRVYYRLTGLSEPTKSLAAGMPNERVVGIINCHIKPKNGKNSKQTIEKQGCKRECWTRMGRAWELL